MTGWWRTYLECWIACGLLGTVAVAAPTPTGLRRELDHALAEFDAGQRLRTGQPDRARQLFRSAAQRLESIAATGVVNGRLEFNLGNAYLQAGDVGRAILHYRAAQRLIPRDALLAENLSVARSRCLTSIQPTRRTQFLRSVFFWHYQTSMPGRAATGLACYAAFWILLAVRSAFARRGITVAAMVFGLIAAAAGASVTTERWLERTAPEGVVTAMDVSVFKGPGESYQRQFEEPLQPGVEFTVRESRGEWWKIELADGKGGWIRASAGEFITPAPGEVPPSVLPM